MHPVPSTIFVLYNSPSGCQRRRKDLTSLQYSIVHWLNVYKYQHNFYIWGTFNNNNKNIKKKRAKIIDGMSQNPPSSTSSSERTYIRALGLILTCSFMLNTHTIYSLKIKSEYEKHHHQRHFAVVTVHSSTIQMSVCLYICVVVIMYLHFYLN